MRFYLLPEHGNFYKVNMHSHSTLSDGKQTPEELKAIYMEKGYSAIAFTEHTRLHNLTHLTDENFVAITSYEIDFIDDLHTPFPALLEKPAEHAHMEAVHMNLYAYDPNTAAAIEVKDLEEKFTIENINEAIRRAREAGFFVIFNHPAGLFVLVTVVDIFGCIVIFQDFVFYHAHARFFHSHLRQPNPRAIRRRCRRPENIIHLTLCKLRVFQLRRAYA